MIDQTHAPERRSWVASANGHSDFPIQNLPFGVFSPPGGEPRGGVAIGDMILDLAALEKVGALSDRAARDAVRAAAAASLNALLDLGAGPRMALRRELSDLLDEAGPARAQAERALAPCLHPASECRLHLPARIGDYTDFYAGINHATNVGKILRPDNPLLPNYKHVPIGYHGRASSIQVSGAPVVRPRGQIKDAAADQPRFAPTERLDIELELGIWIGPGNALGQPIPIGRAASHIGGFCLLNDWSARDIQAWEYQPLGPFLAKNFATTISPWIVTAEALAPFRVAQPVRPAGDPAPLPYLMSEDDQREGGLAVEIEVYLTTERMRREARAPFLLSKANARELFWTVAQFVAHHTCGGCNLSAGDLFGSGTISGTTPESVGSLLERSEGGRKPIELSSGETRRFLEDGDEVTFRGSARRDGFVSIGFGECRGMVMASP